MKKIIALLVLFSSLMILIVFSSASTSAATVFQSACIGPKAPGNYSNITWEMIAKRINRGVPKNLINYWNRGAKKPSSEPMIYASDGTWTQTFPKNEWVYEANGIVERYDSKTAHIYMNGYAGYVDVSKLLHVIFWPTDNNGNPFSDSSLNGGGASMECYRCWNKYGGIPIQQGDFIMVGGASIGRPLPPFKEINIFPATEIIIAGCISVSDQNGNNLVITPSPTPTQSNSIIDITNPNITANLTNENIKTLIDLLRNSLRVLSTNNALQTISGLGSPILRSLDNLLSLPSLFLDIADGISDTTNCLNANETAQRLIAAGSSAIAINSQVAMICGKALISLTSVAMSMTNLVLKFAAIPSGGTSLTLELGLTLASVSWTAVSFIYDREIELLYCSNKANDDFALLRQYICKT